MHEKLRHHLLGWWGGFVCDHPRWVLSVCLILLAASVVLTATRLTFMPDRNELIDKDLPWNQRYIAYRQNFQFDDLIVVIRVPDDADGLARSHQFVDALVKRLDADPTIDKTFWGFETDNISPAAIRLAPMKMFTEQLSQLDDAGLLLKASSFSKLLASVRMELVTRSSSEMNAQQADQAIQQISDVFTAVDQILDGMPTAQLLETLTSSDTPSRQYLSTNDNTGGNQLLFIMIQPKRDPSQLEPVTPAVFAARKYVAELSDQFPGIEAGLTGVPVIEADETKIVERDATLSSILAFVLIGILLVVAFHCWRIPLMVIAGLLVGIGWTFGFLTLSIGHLQLLSIIFTVILLGLGVDFGIHLVSRFELVRPRHPKGVEGFRSAMIETFQTVGPGIITGAVTTALAFGTTLLTDFRGMAEMGLIAGVGILLCLISMFAVFPALMRLTRPEKGHIIPVHRRKIDIYQHHWWQPFVDRPLLPLGFVAVVLIASGFMLPPRYDYDLSKLLPEKSESVYWFRQLEEVFHGENRDTDQAGGVWFGAIQISENNYELARKQVRELQAKSTVAGVGGAGVLFPKDEDRKFELLQQMRQKYAAMLNTENQVKADSPQALRTELQTLLFAMKLGSSMAGDDQVVKKSLNDLSSQITSVIKKLNQLSTKQARIAMSKLADALSTVQQKVRQQMNAALVSRSLTTNDLPDALKREAVGGPNHDILLLKVYPKYNVYNPAKLEAFMQDVYSVDPAATGTVVQIYESNQLIKNAYFKAAIYAFIAVFIVVLIDFQSLVDAVLCLMPVGVAFVTLLGIMASLDFAINPANIIILPLLFGMGVDAGVHMVHRYRHAPDEHPPGLAAGTGKGITMTSLTTIIGFATLMIAQHRGIASLGFTLALGIALTLLACLAVMPAVLELRSRLHRGDAN